MSAYLLSDTQTPGRHLVLGVDGASARAAFLLPALHSIFAGPDDVHWYEALQGRRRRACFFLPFSPVFPPSSRRKTKSRDGLSSGASSQEWLHEKRAEKLVRKYPAYSPLVLRAFSRAHFSS